MASDQMGVGVEGVELVSEGCVALVDSSVEPVVGGRLLGDLPDALDRVQLGGVRRKTVKLDAMTVLAEPLFPLGIEVVARPVVEDEKDLAAAAASDELLEEREECDGIEDRRELVDEEGAGLERDDAVDVCRLALAECVDARLLADPRPGAVKRAVEPKAGLVPEGYDATTPRRFFLIAGNVFRSQYA